MPAPLPAFVLLPMLAAAAGIEISRSHIVGTVVAGIVITMATNVATWLIANKITATRHEERQNQLTENNKQMRDLIDELKGSVAEVTHTVNKLFGEIHDLDKERSNCEIRASQTYASNEQVGQLIVQQVSSNNALRNLIEDMAKGLRESIGKVHGRIDAIDRDVVAIKTRGEKPK